MNKTKITGGLAAVLVAAGLAVAVTPTGAQADDNGVLVLSEAQTEDLSARLQLDVYGDLTQRAEDPQDAAVPGFDTGDAGDTGGDKGSGAHLDAVPPVKATFQSAVEGAQGMAVTVPVTNPAGDYFTLHALGNIARRTADGKVKWQRSNTSFYQEWNLPPAAPRFPAEPYPARILMGFNAVGPFTPGSDNGYATGDLTGDGVPDLAFTADVGTFPFRPFTKPGYPLNTGTFVTVLDGATGATLWSEVYTSVYNIALVDQTLVIADSPRFNLNAPATSKVTLTGLRFSAADGALAPSVAWTFDTGKTKADNASWASLEPIGDGLLAASWNLVKNSVAAVPEGHTLVLDTADGAVTWQTGTGDRLYSRQLHVDRSRNRIVGLEQGDPNEGVLYEIAAYNLTTGKRSTLQTRINALPIDLEIADIRGNTKTEYTVSEDTLDSNLFVNANTIRALDGKTAKVLWSRTVKRDPAWGRDGATAWGLTAVDDTIVANYNDDQLADAADNRTSIRYARFAALAGKNGNVRWERRGVVASQAWAQAYRQKSKWLLRTVDTDQNIRTYDLGKGRQQAVTPIQSVLSSAVLVDVNNDGTQDVVAGGQSQGLYAYDGASLLAGTPKMLWQSTMPGQIHEIVKANVTGDPREELVVAADTATAVVDYRAGTVLTSIPGNGQYVWDVTAANLTGNGRAEIVVPTDRVRAYTGAGKRLWVYAAPADAGDVVFTEASVGDDRVYVEYATRDAFITRSGAVGGVALAGGTGKVAWTAEPQIADATGPAFATPVWAATYASPEIPYANGHAVVMTWNAPSALNPQQVWAEIRDGRTGEVLHTAKLGGSWTIGNWFTGPEGLYLSGTATVRLFAPGGTDFSASVSAQSETGQFVTGSGDTRYLLLSGAGGFQLSDPAAVTSATFLPAIFSRSLQGNREMVAGDLDGDGTDELVSLNFDAAGTDRQAGLEQGGYSVPYTAIRSLSVFTLDPA